MGKKMVLSGLQEDLYLPILAIGVSVTVVIHSLIVHKFQWKRPRINTELGAWSLIISGALLLIAYLDSHGRGERMLLRDVLVNGVLVAVVQASDNILILDCVESVGGRVKKGRTFIIIILFLLLFAWLPLGILADVVPQLFGLRARAVKIAALIYPMPILTIYNGVLEVLLFRALWRFGRVKNTHQHRLYILIFKTLVRSLLSTVGAVVKAVMAVIGRDIAGSMIYCLLVVLSNHLLFNITIDKGLAMLLFRHKVFSKASRTASKHQRSSMQSTTFFGYAPSMGYVPHIREKGQGVASSAASPRQQGGRPRSESHRQSLGIVDLQKELQRLGLGAKVAPLEERKGSLGETPTSSQGMGQGVVMSILLDSAGSTLPDPRIRRMPALEMTRLDTIESESGEYSHSTARELSDGLSARLPLTARESVGSPFASPRGDVSSSSRHDSLSSAEGDGDRGSSDAHSMERKSSGVAQGELRGSGLLEPLSEVDEFNQSSRSLLN